MFTFLFGCTTMFQKNERISSVCFLNKKKKNQQNERMSKNLTNISRYKKRMNKNNDVKHSAFVQKRFL